MGICEDAPDEYCGHILEPGDAGSDREADENWHIRNRTAVCLREPLRKSSKSPIAIQPPDELQDDGLCVWHASGMKYPAALVNAGLTPDDVPWDVDHLSENLNGAAVSVISVLDRYRPSDLPEFSFHGCSLVRAHFSDPIYEAPKFHHTNLREATFGDGDFGAASFDHATLNGAEFSNTDLQYAGFRNATLSKVDVLEGRVVKEAEFSNSCLSSASFHYAMASCVKFRDCELDGVEFHETNLFRAKFYDCELDGAEFQDAKLSEARFHDCEFDGAEFHDTNLSETQFYDCEFNEVEFQSATLSQAQFYDSDLSGSTFTNTDLQDVKFLNNNITNARFSESKLNQGDFSGTTLQKSVFSKADLRGVTIKSACVRKKQSKGNDTTDPLGASLEDAQFEDGTDLRGADLSGARLYQTAFRDVRINDKTTFGIEEGRYGEKCRYEYDLNTGVSMNEDVPRLQAATWTYRRLESLFEENAMDERARDAHIRKQEAQRKDLRENEFPPDQSLRPLGQYLVSTVNWHLHRHGESLRRLLGVSGLLILFCGFVYVGAGVTRNNPETTYQITLTDLTNPGAVLVDLLNGLYFSVITFSTIGYGDFYPTSPISRLLVGIESLAGALLIALFVFVIGRRVAR